MVLHRTLISLHSLSSWAVYVTYALIQRMRFIQNSDPNVVSGKPEYKSSPPEILSRFKLHETVGIQSQNVTTVIGQGTWLLVTCEAPRLFWSWGKVPELSRITSSRLLLKMRALVLSSVAVRVSLFKIFVPTQESRFRSWSRSFTQLLSNLKLFESVNLNVKGYIFFFKYSGDISSVQNIQRFYLPNTKLKIEHRNPDPDSGVKLRDHAVESYFKEISLHPKILIGWGPVARTFTYRSRGWKFTLRDTTTFKHLMVRAGRAHFHIPFI